MISFPFRVVVPAPYRRANLIGGTLLGFKKFSHTIRHVRGWAHNPRKCAFCHIETASNGTERYLPPEYENLAREMRRDIDDTLN